MMKACRFSFLLTAWLLLIPCLSAQRALLKFEDKGEFLSRLMAKKPEQFGEILRNPDQYEVQIIYTRIARDENNKPHFKHFSWHLTDSAWFSPASLVKLPVAAMALEKLNMLSVDGLDKFCRMEHGAVQGCQTLCTKDSSSPTGYPSVAHYIKKIFLVSDNDAYNRLYEFLGQKYMNERLWNMGYTNARILHRYWNCGVAENRCTNPVTFYDSTGKVLVELPAANNPDVLCFPFGKAFKGINSWEEGAQVIQKPADFTYTNFMPLQDLHQVLISLLMPKILSDDQRFRLSESDYVFLRSCMSMLPKESRHPYYDPYEFHDSYAKYLMFGDSKDTIPSNIRIFNKVGQAYGYLSDCAYIVDYDRKIEFFLSAVIYCNPDGVMNDNKDEVEEIGFPFLGNLGRLIYEYETSRTRKYPPKLKKYPPLVN